MADRRAGAGFAAKVLDPRARVADGFIEDGPEGGGLGTADAREPGSAHRRRRGRLAVVAALLFPVAILAVVATGMYSSAFVDARERLERTARIGQAHAARVVETNDVLARVLLQAAGEADDASLRDQRERVHQTLWDLTKNLGQIQSIWLWDRTGAPLWSSRFAIPPGNLNVSDRGYFVAARQGLYEDWYVSEPLLSRSTGEPFVDFTRRRTLASGEFGGVVSISLFPAYFANFYRELTVREPDLAVALVRRDGQLIARWPASGDISARLAPDSALLEKMSAGLEQGETRGRSLIDRKERILYFRAVEGLPLYVAASLPVQAVVAGWSKRVIALAAFVLPLAGALAALALVALRRADREAEALDRYRTESEKRSTMEEALRQSQKLEAMGRITGGVAHDFNNLLMVVSNNALLLDRLMPSSADRAQVAAIRRAVASGTKLTRQLLSFARRQPLHPTVVSLPAMLPELADLMRTAVGRSIEVTERVENDVPPIEVDTNELELALLNLAVNARDAMPNGGRLLLVARRAHTGEAEVPTRGDHVAVSVSDTGVGMDNSVMKHAFEPFFTTKPQGKGTGLGLAQVYGFVSQSGGMVKLESGPGVGTTVVLYFPASLKAVTRTDGVAVPPLSSLVARVLYVEDNPDVASATTQLLEAAGCIVTRAATAVEAMPLVATQDFDVVLSDIVMPGDMNGLSLARAIRRMNDRLSIVLMTGYSDELHQALAEGFEVLPKPCTADALLHAMRRATAHR